MTATDPRGSATAQTFVWTVANPAPTATPDTNEGDVNATLTGTVLTNDADTDGAPLFVGSVNGLPTNVGLAVPGDRGGSFTINPNGSFSFVPGKCCRTPRGTGS